MYKINKLNETLHLSKIIEKKNHHIKRYLLLLKFIFTNYLMTHVSYYYKHNGIIIIKTILFLNGLFYQF